jgi:hypothetical protein
MSEAPPIPESYAGFVRLTDGGAYIGKLDQSIKGYFQNRAAHPNFDALEVPIILSIRSAAYERVCALASVISSTGESTVVAVATCQQIIELLKSQDVLQIILSR